MAVNIAKRRNDIFTPISDEDDRILLDIRVLLGKMTVRYEDYSRQTKTAFIEAMLCSNHREYLIYVMKALTSNDVELVDSALFTLRERICIIPVPDKLLRNLISLPSVTARDNDLIKQIFLRYFEDYQEDRSNRLFKDKIYNYLVVMLDTNFEHYRKNFMIPDIMEKDYPVEFQGIRRLILEVFNPEVKRKLLNFVNGDDSSILKGLFQEISERISHVPENYEQNLKDLIEVLSENDPKAREITASRIHDIDYEKRYLRIRLTRMCDIIGLLRIEEASVNLVKIFNYVKKYYDRELYNAVTMALSLLNYPYMLGELEVQLLSGNEEEQLHAVELLSLYHDQRSINIIMDYLKKNATSETRLIEFLLETAIKRDVHSNVVVQETGRLIIEQNRNARIRKNAVYLLGRSGDEADIEYLSALFAETSEIDIKESIVQAMANIALFSEQNVQKKIQGLLRDYLKDPAVRVRKHACISLLKLGDRSALRSLSDMMIIKNREVQREILLILGRFMTVDIAFFLLSLLKEEYAISDDVIPLLKFLGKEDQLEIDHFVSNLFKRFEGANFDFSFGVRTETQKVEESELKKIVPERYTILRVRIDNYYDLVNASREHDISVNYHKLFVGIMSCISANNGTVNSMGGGYFIVYFKVAPFAAAAALEIRTAIDRFNEVLLPVEHLHARIMLEEVDVPVINGEIIFHLTRASDVVFSSELKDRIIVAGELAGVLSQSFENYAIPRVVLGRNRDVDLRQICAPVNLLMLAEEQFMFLKNRQKERLEIERQLDEGAAPGRGQQVSTHEMIDAMRAMDEVGKMLKKELGEVQKYINQRSTDRELIRNVEKMLGNVYKRYILESNKIMME
jgi:HEAT repeat protein